jgi:hypothetical protein
MVSVVSRKRFSETAGSGDDPVYRVDELENASFCESDMRLEPEREGKKARGNGW